eukprot:CAMPEP_0194050758 /NCGR_PEP_ID=MMETSP0009_2-20130614/36914_1 /TAXON_ID=210454 /ORGANISM="Grammatophora oceanica, Strain CCMP 410" /LENGTH=189 /DNA_ID=CAMNT_0038697549 /DNA_START=12 /DNA_END=581 /DNA_ORIENTATION=-
MEQVGSSLKNQSQLEDDALNELCASLSCALSIAERVASSSLGVPVPFHDSFIAEAALSPERGAAHFSKNELSSMATNWSDAEEAEAVIEAEIEEELQKIEEGIEEEKEEDEADDDADELDVQEGLKQESRPSTAEVLAAMATLQRYGNVVENDDMVRHVRNFRTTYMKEKRKKKQTQPNLNGFFKPPST